MIKYGVNWPKEYDDIDIELKCFLDGTEKFGGMPNDRPFHFKNVVSYYWGPHCRKHFQWNPWNLKMLKEACRHKWLKLSGCAASTKSTFLAVWGLVNWMAAPSKTCVLATSTSLKESRMRVFGYIEDYFNSAVDEDGQVALPGKLVSSEGKIRTRSATRRASDRCGIHLVAGDRAKEKENIGKLIGLHNERIFFLCDEMPELSPALTNAASSNLVVNPYFQLISSGNFKSIYDPFGTSAEPLNGWATVDVNTDEWETKDGGLCLRFDGLKSPNIIAGYDKYPGMYGPAHLIEHQKVGEHSAAFWRMCRSFPCADAEANMICTEADLIRGRVHDTIQWLEIPIKWASLDPAFATGGDKAVAYFGKFGIAISGKRVMQVDERKELLEDVRKVNESRPLQVAKQFRDECIRREIMPENAAYDGTGGGIVFGPLLSELWCASPLAVQFGGAPSDLPINSDGKPAKEAYTNRVTELWFQDVEFIQSGHIKGLPIEAAKDLKSRKYETMKQGGQCRNRVESKEDMKKRIGRSPDDGDAFSIGVELLRQRHGFVAGGLEGKRAQRKSTWLSKQRSASSVYEDGYTVNSTEALEAA